MAILAPLSCFSFLLRVVLVGLEGMRTETHCAYPRHQQRGDMLPSAGVGSSMGCKVRREHTNELLKNGVESREAWSRFQGTVWRAWSRVGGLEQFPPRHGT